MNNDRPKEKEIDNKNIILQADSYKMGHWAQYLPGTEYLYSYLEPRVGAKYPESVMFGLQYLLKEYLQGQVITEEKIQQAKSYIEHHLGKGVFAEQMWYHILEKHQGKLPIAIYAVPEGMRVPASNVMIAITNTDPMCAPLVNFLETMIMSSVWPTITVASKAYHIRKLLEHYANMTAEDIGCVDYQLHAFGARSTFGLEAQAMAGAAHLLSFKGTDFVSPSPFIEKYYNTPAKYIDITSVAATEHSVMTQAGPIDVSSKRAIIALTEDQLPKTWEDIDFSKLSGEELVFANLLRVHPTGILSVVIDSYDSHFFVSHLCRKYKNIILQRKGKLVLRPDSGNPVTESLEIVKRADAVFGSSVNVKGYRVLNPNVGVLYGDGINPESIVNILENLIRNGYASSNLVLGMGTELTQNVSRDTQKFAFKASAIARRGSDGKLYWHNVFKDPVTANVVGEHTIDKRSKRGIQVLRFDERNNQYYTESHNIEMYDELDLDCKYPTTGIMQKVFCNGELLVDYHWTSIKQRVLF